MNAFGFSSGLLRASRASGPSCESALKSARASVSTGKDTEICRGITRGSASGPLLRGAQRRGISPSGVSISSWGVLGWRVQGFVGFRVVYYSQKLSLKSESTLNRA